jgi:hypothetical protein
MNTIVTEEKSSAEEQRTSSAPAETECHDRYQRAKARVEAIRGFYIHLAIYLLVNLCLFAINMLSDPHSLWFYWPLLGWGIAVAIHALTVFWSVAAPGSDWEERKIREYMNQDR